MDESITDIQLQQTVLETLEPKILNIDNKKPSKPCGKDKHLKKSCPVCFKIMRSDHLKRHLKTHNVTQTKNTSVPCNICTKFMRKDNLKRHLKTHKKLIVKDDNHKPSSSEQDIVSLLIHDQNQFNDKRRMGSLVKTTLLTQSIEPQSLRKEMREALDIHECYKKLDTDTCNLKGWQKELLSLMETPTDREIIWVIGKRGNEGKTWLQKYIEQYFGTRRVFRTSIVKDVSSLLHLISKRTLACTDIFLLNISRSFDIADVPYTVLEDLKDGQASSAKYNSKILKFCTPNVLVIFSNYSPMCNKVSKDRWRIYIIDETNDKLVATNDDKRPLSIKEMKQYRRNKLSSEQESEEDGVASHFVSF